MTEFDVEVRTMIPASRFKQLQTLATQHHTTVGALIGELARRAMTPKPAPTRGRPSRYTPEIGERILESRTFHRSYSEIAAEEHISIQTAQRYAQRAQADARAKHLDTTKENYS